MPPRIIPRDLPRVARIMQTPRRDEAAGVRRYGFHGLSYTFLVQELARVAGPGAARAAPTSSTWGPVRVRGRPEGRYIDTATCFTMAAGLVMAPRLGVLDPGLIHFLGATEGMTLERFDQLVQHGPGLLGISETSPDVRDLLARKHDDIRAANAIDLFRHLAPKWIGAMAAASRTGRFPPRSDRTIVRQGG